MASYIRISDRRLEPELYVNLELRRSLSEEELARIRTELQRRAADVFRQRFGSGDFAFEILLEEGSLKTKITVTLGTLVFLLSQYANIRQGLDYLVKDVSWAFDTLRPVIQQVVGPKNVLEEIRSEKRLGAIARLDEVLRRFQEGKIEYDEYMREAVSILGQIQQSSDRQALTRSLVKYIDTIYPDSFDWEGFRRRVEGLRKSGPSIGSSSPTGSQLPTSPNGPRGGPDLFVDEDKRRRRRRE